MISAVSQTVDNYQYPKYLPILITIILSKEDPGRHNAFSNSLGTLPLSPPLPVWLGLFSTMARRYKWRGAGCTTVYKWLQTKLSYKICSACSLERVLWKKIVHTKWMALCTHIHYVSFLFDRKSSLWYIITYCSLKMLCAKSLKKHLLYPKSEQFVNEFI